MSVEPVEDGSLFRVTLGPAPRLFMFRTRHPPKLGQRVAVEGDVRTTRALGRDGSISTLDVGSCEVVGESRRLVDELWTERVQRAMARPLLPYQIEGAGWVASRLVQHVGAILGDDMGLGKTAQAIAALCATNAFPAIVVCPASVKQQWWEEFQHASEVPTVCIVDGRYSPLPSAHVYVCNYELLKYRQEQFAALNPRLYVFDEGHQLKNPTARGNHRASVATRLVRRTGGALILTGTPIMNVPVELWRLLHLAAPRAWPSFSAYKERFCQPERGKEIGRTVLTSAGRVERLDELHAAIGPFMLRRLKGDVLAELPPKERRSAVVRLGGEELAHYRHAERDVVAWLHAVGEDKRAVHAAVAPGLARLTYLRRIAAIGKVRGPVPAYLRAWRARHPDEPLVIFGYHKDVMLGLWHVCQGLNLRVTGIGGRESHEKRRAHIEAFQAGEADVFLAPIAIAGVGLNLQRACHALFVERIWTPSGMVQAEDRIHRLGQTRPVTITYIDAADTVDEDIAHVLSQKQRLIDAVVDDRPQSVESMETVIDVMARMRSA